MAGRLVMVTAMVRDTKYLHVLLALALHCALYRDHLLGGGGGGAGGSIAIKAKIISGLGSFVVDGGSGCVVFSTASVMLFVLLLR